MRHKKTQCFWQNSIFMKEIRKNCNPIIKEAERRQYVKEIGNDNQSDGVCNRIL